MSGDAKDLRVGGLDLIAQGITLALDELRELGMTGRAGAGRGFEELALGDLELGHGELVAGLKSFCERWEGGVRSLVNEGNSFARPQNLTGQSDEEYEATLDDAFGPSAEERAETSRQFVPQQPEGGADGSQQGGHRAPRGGDTG
ncbi:hypothetical protein [Streptomyces alboflavus]|uniref:hypothetical protein n=1 Tax=Streptomyces alboflavus TaxID=67267 RepID=UPI000690CFF8